MRYELCKFLPAVMFLLVLLLSMATKKVARVTADAVLSMLDSSLSGSEFDDDISNELDNNLGECATKELDDDLEDATRENNDSEVYRGSPSAEQQERSGNVSDEGGPGPSSAAEKLTGTTSDEGGAGTDNADERSSNEAGAGSDNEEERSSDEAGAGTDNEEERSSDEAGAGTDNEEERSSDEAGAGTDNEEERSSDEAGAGSDEGSTPKSRKTVRRPKNWKKNKRITRRNSGKRYTSAPGKQVMLLNYLALLYFHGSSLHHPLTHSLTPSPSLSPSLPPLYRSKPINLMIHHVAVLCAVMTSCLLRNGKNI